MYWLLYCAFLLYMSTQSSLNSMSHSPTFIQTLSHTHNHTTMNTSGAAQGSVSYRQDQPGFKLPTFPLVDNLLLRQSHPRPNCTSTFIFDLSLQILRLSSLHRTTEDRLPAFHLTSLYTAKAWSSNHGAFKKPRVQFIDQSACVYECSLQLHTVPGHFARA